MTKPDQLEQRTAPTERAVAPAFAPERPQDPRDTQGVGAGYEVRSIKASVLLEHGQGLFQAHWDEIALNKELMSLNPDIHRYKLMEESGALFAIGVFVGEQLVGYSVNFVTPHLHYANLICAQNDLLFLDKAHRASGAGMALIQATEHEAKARGARMLIMHAKQRTALETLLPRIGYGVQDIMFSKEI